MQEIPKEDDSVAVMARQQSVELLQVCRCGAPGNWLAQRTIGSRLAEMSIGNEQSFLLRPVSCFFRQ